MYICCFSSLKIMTPVRLLRTIRAVFVFKKACKSLIFVGRFDAIFKKQHIPTLHRGCAVPAYLANRRLARMNNRHCAPSFVSSPTCFGDLRVRFERCRFSVILFLVQTFLRRNDCPDFGRRQKRPPVHPSPVGRGFKKFRFEILTLFPPRVSF